MLFENCKLLNALYPQVQGEYFGNSYNLELWIILNNLLWLLYSVICQSQAAVIEAEVA